MAKENKSSSLEIILAVVSTVFIIAFFSVFAVEVYKGGYSDARVEEQQKDHPLTVVQDEEKRLVAAIDAECKKSGYKYGISSSFKEIEYSGWNPRDEGDPLYRLNIYAMLPNLQQVKDIKQYYDLIRRLEDVAKSELDDVEVIFITKMLSGIDVPVPISAEEDKYGLMYISNIWTDLCYIGKKENGVIKPLSEIMPYVGMREGAINLTKLGAANTVKDETKTTPKYYYWHTKDAGGVSVSFRYYAQITVQNGVVEDISLKPENKNFKYSSSSSSSSSSSHYYKPSKKDEEETTKKFSDPYNVQDFGDPEDFYDYWYDDFEDYEEAYDYYYDHYPY